jgi:hypothetical protein
LRPSRHVNPRAAVVCAECGSRDLSTPAPRPSFIMRALLGMLPISIGTMLVLISISVMIAIMRAIIANQELQGEAFLVILLVGLLWLGYMQLPRTLRNLFGGSNKERGRRNSHGSH